MSDHCKILRAIKDIIATLIWVTARRSLGITGLIKRLLCRLFLRSLKISTCTVAYC